MPPEPELDVPPNASAQGSDAVTEWSAVVRERIRIPLDPWAVTAILEAEGLRDEDARERFGYPSLFAFARAVFVTIRSHGGDGSPAAIEPTSGEGPWRLARHLALGSFFALPLAAQLAVLFSTGHALSASLSFSPNQATAVGIATAGSFLATGGANVAMGRQGAALREAGAFGLLLRMLGTLTKAGGLCVVGVAAASAAVHFVSPFLPRGEELTTLGYFLLLSAEWLALAQLYVLHGHLLALVTTLMGALAVAPLVRLGLRVTDAQLVALSVTVALALGAAQLRLRMRRTQSREADAAFGLPRPDVLMGNLLPYVAYGTGYFALLFSDRVFVWSAGPRMGASAFQFDAAYELAVDAALVGLIPPLAYLEHVLRELYLTVERDQQLLPLSKRSVHGTRITAQLTGAFTRLVVVCAVSMGLAAWVAGRFVWPLQGAPDAASLPTEALGLPTGGLGSLPLDGRIVFVVAALAYELLAVGLMGALVHFALSRPEPVVRAVWRAAAVACCVGYASSRLLGPHWACLALAGGAAWFAFDLLARVPALARKLDYMHYASY